MIRYDMAIMNLADRPLELVATSGLVPLDPDQFRAIDASDPQRAARLVDHAYRVSGDRWSLKLKSGRESVTRSATDPSNRPEPGGV